MENTDKKYTILLLKSSINFSNTLNNKIVNMWYLNYYQILKEILLIILIIILIKLYPKTIKTKMILKILKPLMFYFLYVSNLKTLTILILFT